MKCRLATSARLSRRVAAAAILVRSLVPSSDAWARDAVSSAAAQALFDEGRKLVATQNYAAACPKFAESQTLDPGAGTQLHLGNCYEKLGKTASAWATYIDASSAAKAQGRADWAETAKQRASALEPKLARVTVVVVERLQGLEVRRDNVLLTEGSFGVAIPVDPGEHTFEASAPKRNAWRTRVTIPDSGRVDVTVPALVVAVATTDLALAKSTGSSNDAPSLMSSEKPRGSGVRTAGFLVGGVGVLGLGLGAVTGLMALSKNDRAKELCPSAGGCAVAEGVTANDSAKTLGTVSTLSVVAGGTVALAGLALVLFGGAKVEAKPHSRISPTLASQGAGVGVEGVFQ